MPLIMVRRHTTVSDAQLEAVLGVLPRVTAKALTCGPVGSQTHLTEAEIEIWVTDAHKHDRGTSPLEIMIFAHDTEERRKNLFQRQIQIGNAVREALLLTPATKSTDGWIWIFLGYSDWAPLWPK